jgi:hypothetical protein
MRTQADGKPIRQVGFVYVLNFGFVVAASEDCEDRRKRAVEIDGGVNERIEVLSGLVLRSDRCFVVAAIVFALHSTEQVAVVDHWCVVLGRFVQVLAFDLLQAFRVIVMDIGAKQ